MAWWPALTSSDASRVYNRPAIGMWRGAPVSTLYTPPPSKGARLGDNCLRLYVTPFASAWQLPKREENR